MRSAEGANKSQVASELGISRASLYYRAKLPEKDDALRKRIEGVMFENPGYGYRRVGMSLGINHKRAKRVMRKFGLKPARRAKAPRKPLDIGNAPASRPDILSKICPIIPDLVWASDFTFISFKGAWYYLATVLDVYSWVPLGFNVSRTHDAVFVKVAIQRAIKAAGRTPTWFHSDQGSEYNSDEVSYWLERKGVSISMSPKSSPWRNGSQESFFGRFKVEFGDPDRFQTPAEFLEAIFIHLHYFTHKRIKNRLKMPPAEFRANWLSTPYPQLSTAYQSPPAAGLRPATPSRPSGTEPTAATTI